MHLGLIQEKNPTIKGFKEAEWQADDTIFTSGYFIIVTWSSISDILLYFGTIYPWELVEC